MRHRSKLLLTGLTAALLMAIAVSSASAQDFSINEQRFDAEWTALRFTAAGQTISCPVTIQGSFHTAVIDKNTELVGHVTRAIVRGGAGGGECTGGTASILATSLPWHITYEGFTGTLPNIERINLLLVRPAFSVDPSGIPPNCLALADESDPAFGWIELDADGTVTALNADPETSLPLTGGGGTCSFAGNGSFAGRAAATRLGTTGSIEVDLI